MVGSAPISRADCGDDQPGEATNSAFGDVTPVRPGAHRSDSARARERSFAAAFRANSPRPAEDDAHETARASQRACVGTGKRVSKRKEPTQVGISTDGRPKLVRHGFRTGSAGELLGGARSQLQGDIDKADRVLDVLQLLRPRSSKRTSSLLRIC